MYRDPLEELGFLQDQGSRLAREITAARSGASSTQGKDDTGVVTVAIDTSGQVSAVTVASSWRRQLGVNSLGGAVQEAAQVAVNIRLTQWGETYAEEQGAATGASGGAIMDADGFAAQLNQAATATMSSGDGRAAMEELLQLAMAVERGIDDVSERLQSTVEATYTGRGQGRSVTVTISGGGDVLEVRYVQAWLLEAHEINIGRQTLAAFRDAYEQAAERGVDRLIAGSSLGEVQRLSQDPFGLARRLRLRG